MATNSDSNSAQKRTGLLRLPNETLLQIAQDLSLVDLLSLALLCRRLHYFALHLYFLRHGVQDLRSSLKVDFLGSHTSHRGNERTLSPYTYLPGIRIALFIDYVREIEFVFRNSPYILRDIAEAAHLVSRLTRLDHVKLNFERLVLWPSGKSLCTEFGQHNLTSLALHLGSIVDGIHAKSCASFTVCHGELQTYPYQGFVLVEEMKKAKLSRHKITTLMRQVALGRKVPDWQVLTGPPLEALRTFNFESSLLVRYPFLPWALETLRRSSRTLVELSFCNLHMGMSDWSHFLPRISLPSLSTLSIPASCLKLSDFSSFLRRHPRITSLCLCAGAISTGHERIDTFPAGLLSALTSLCGPADCILHFLQHGAQFPCLVHVDIQPFNRPFDPLECLARQNKALALVAKLTPPPGKHIQLTITLFRDNLHPSHVTGTLAIPASGVERTLWNVRTLKLKVAAGFPFIHDPALLARWLALYPALREVTFVREFFPPAFDETGKQVLIESIVGACPQMEYVAIGEDRRSVG